MQHKQLFEEKTVPERTLSKWEIFVNFGLGYCQALASKYGVKHRLLEKRKLN